MTTSTAIPEWVSSNIYLQWAFPAIIVLALILIALAILISSRRKTK